MAAWKKIRQFQHLIVDQASFVDCELLRRARMRKQTLKESQPAAFYGTLCTRTWRCSNKANFYKHKHLFDISKILCDN